MSEPCYPLPILSDSPCIVESEFLFECRPLAAPVGLLLPPLIKKGILCRFELPVHVFGGASPSVCFWGRADWCLAPLFPHRFIFSSNSTSQFLQSPSTTSPGRLHPLSSNLFEHRTHSLPLCGRHPLSRLHPVAPPNCLHVPGSEKS